MKVFLTGAAGFIGFHVAKTLLDQGHDVCGVDNLNDYYDVRYKDIRLKILRSYSAFSFSKIDLCEKEGLSKVYKAFDPTHVLNLAAQAGVRYSLTNPDAYIQANIVGFQNVLELARHSQPTNFVYASSSSVYGGNKTIPFSESHEVSNPISLYAATKLSNELVAKTYGHLYDLPNTGLRFFTVYGPYGRPDMALFIFTRKMSMGEAIPVFHHGKMIRDFTYIEDIVNGICASLQKPQKNKVYNLGRGKQEHLSDFIETIENSLGVKSKKELLPIQPGDVEKTYADVSLAKSELNYEPKTQISKGIPLFVNWFRETHDANGELLRSI